MKLFILLTFFLAYACSFPDIKNPCDPSSSTYLNAFAIKIALGLNSPPCGTDLNLSRKEINSYSIPALGLTGIISGNQISLASDTLSSFSPLIANFTTTGSSITVSGVEQQSGVSVNSYNTNLIYKVTARDGSSQDYTVTLTAPRTYGSGSLRIWLRADSLNLTDGAPVATWNDLSGFSNDFAQAIPAQQPIYIRNQINGLPSLRFTQVASSALETSTGTGFYGINDSGSFFIVLKFNQHIGAVTILNLSGVNGRQFDISNSPNVVFTPGRNGIGSIVTSGLLIPLSSYIAIGSIQNLLTSQNEIWNGDLKGTQTVGVLGYVSSGSAYISNGNLDADIAELLFFNTALSQNEIDKVFCYLRLKYNLTSTNKSCGL
ncbi:MAG: DUF5018 domain-containing protein [Leptospiraceae bacterium]|nr:DUF5018 domain-containing protein [Leptospiraceae bacterium]